MHEVPTAVRVLPPDDHDMVVRTNQQLYDFMESQKREAGLLAEAVVIFRTNVEAKFVTQNEFRGALSDAQTHMPTKDEVRNLVTAIDKRVNEVSERIAAVQVQIAATGGLASQLEEMSKTLVAHGGQLAAMAGKGTGLDKAWGYLIGLAGLVALVITLLRR